MNTEVTSLGNLATSAELKAARCDKGSAEHIQWLSLAKRYRAAQHDLLVTGKTDYQPYPLATVLTDDVSPLFKRVAWGLLIAATILAVVLTVML